MTTDIERLLAFDRGPFAVPTPLSGAFPCGLRGASLDPFDAIKILEICDTYERTARRCAVLAAAELVQSRGWREARAALAAYEPARAGQPPLRRRGRR